MVQSAHSSFRTPNEDEVVILHFAVMLDCSRENPKGKSSLPRERNLAYGQSVAGTVLQVGRNVTKFSLSQRVLTYSRFHKNDDLFGTESQQYSTVPQTWVCPMPDSLKFHEAATLPLSVTLAAVGLYQKNHLSLPLPRLESAHTGKIVVVLGGASDIGAMAVQLAVASGVRVIATSSKPDTSLVKSFGASIVIQQEPFAHTELLAALGMGNIPLAGIFDAISTDESFEFVDAVLGDIHQLPPVCAIRPPAKPPKLFIPSVAISSTMDRYPHTIVRAAIWEDYLPEALKVKRLRAKPVQTVLRVRKGNLKSVLAATRDLPQQCTYGAIVVSYV